MSFPLEIKFNRHDYTLTLVLPSIEIPERIKSIGFERELILKPEFHISIVVSDTARRVRDLVEEFQQRQETLQNLETLAHTQDWDYERTGKYSLHEEVYTQEKLLRAGKADVPPHIRRSLIERVDLPDLQKYYAGLTAIFGPAFNPPVAHITLFTWSDFAPLAHRGISISSEEEYRATLVEEL